MRRKPQCTGSGSDNDKIFFIIPLLIRQKNRIGICGRAGSDAQMACTEKEAVLVQRQRDKCALQRDRGRRRDEKRAGRAGPPDCAEVPEAIYAETSACACLDVEARAGAPERETGGDWDVIGQDDIASVDACQRPCITRCTVS